MSPCKDDAHVWALTAKDVDKAMKAANLPGIDSTGGFSAWLAWQASPAGKERIRKIERGTYAKLTS